MMKFLIGLSLGIGLEGAVFVLREVLPSHDLHELGWLYIAVAGLIAMIANAAKK